MFDFIKGVAGSVAFKIMVAVVVAGAGAFGVYYWQNVQRDKELDTVKRDLNTVSVGKQINDDAAQKFETATRINEDSRVETKEAVTVVERKIVVADLEARAREAAIRSQYNELLAKAGTEQQKPALVAEAQEKISAVRIAEMWAIFCKGVPTHPKCSIPASPASGAQP
jgi:hypothetical protein